MNQNTLPIIAVRKRPNDSILIVDDEKLVRRLLEESLEYTGYHYESASDAFEAMEKIKAGDFSLILLDLKMPRKSGLQFLKELVEDYRDFLAVIVLSSVTDVAVAVEALKFGAYDYVTKPFDIEDLKIRIDRALERRHFRIENYQVILETLVRALDAREHETSNHSKRVAEYTVTLARKLGIKGRDLLDIKWGAFLHDVGKIGVPDSILLKHGGLSELEWVEMRKHPEIGYRIVKEIEFLNNAAEIVLSHQERFDGKGYPRGLKAKEICLGARIFSIVDAFDAITSDRPYRKSLDYRVARQEIITGSGSQFDPDLVDVFLDISKEEWTHIRAETVQTINNKDWLMRK